MPLLLRGASPSTSSATYTPNSGNVNVLKNGVAPTWSNKCDGAAAGTVNQKVHWTGGTGTVDPSTGAATISFTGKLWVNFYSGLSPFSIQDPVVTVQSNGDGTVVGTMGGFAADRDNPTAPALPIADVANVTISDLSGVASNNTTGFVTTPDYAGILITPPAGASPQNTTNAFVGAFPQSFVTFHGNTGLASFWYSSGDSFDPTKAASAITVAYGTLSGDPDPDPDPDPPTPGTGEQVISATVPDEVDPGEFIWTIDAVDHSVTLTEAADQGTFLQSTGNLKPIKVTDSRAARSDLDHLRSAQRLHRRPLRQVPGVDAERQRRGFGRESRWPGALGLHVRQRPEGHLRPRVGHGGSRRGWHRHHRRRSRPAPPEGHGRRHLLGDPDHHGPVMTQPTPQPRFTRSAQLMSKHPQRSWRRRATALVAAALTAAASLAVVAAPRVGGTRQHHRCHLRVGGARHRAVRRRDRVTTSRPVGRSGTRRPTTRLPVTLRSCGTASRRPSPTSAT